MRVLFFGTSDFAVPTLHALADSDRHEVLAVVTQPDRPHGRGLRVAASPVKLAALQRRLPVLQPRRVRSTAFLESARDLGPDTLVLASFGQIIPQALLDLPPRGPINVHASLLPAYRGAAPIQRAIMNGETETGVTTMWMDATLDTGDILLARPLRIAPDDTAGTLIPRLADLGAELLLETLDLQEAGKCPRVRQDDSGATYAPALAASDSMVPWADPADRIRNRIRALSPRPGAFTTVNGRRVKLWRAVLGSAGAGDPGVVLSVTNEGVEVGTGDGRLILLEVQAENGRRMAAPDWARGARITPGDRFEGG